MPSAIAASEFTQASQFIPQSYRSQCRTDFSPMCGGKVIYLVENEATERNALLELLEPFSEKVICFGSVAEYLRHDRSDESACLIVDVRLPDDVDRADVQQQLDVRTSPPIIFISGKIDIPTAVRAMKAGAMEFLTKPVDSEALVTAVQSAFVQDAKNRLKRADMGKLQERFYLLTPREREVFPLVVGGLPNKQAAALLDISAVTLQIHRSRIMRKMEAGSFAGLVRMAIKLRIPHWRGQRTSYKEHLFFLAADQSRLSKPLQVR